jgi:two-component system, OmpR family, response regulator
MTNKITLQNEELPCMSVQHQPYPCRRILVVEDDPEIRRLNAQVLQDSGYRVDTAIDGISGWNALDAARHAHDSYDLLITDYNLPGLTGLDLVEKLRIVHLALPVIMAAGTLPMDRIMGQHHWLQPLVTLPKPYSVEQFLGTVEAVLQTSDIACGRLLPISRLTLTA